MLREVATAFYTGKRNAAEQGRNITVWCRLPKLQVILRFLIRSSHIGLGFYFLSRPKLCKKQ